MNDKLKAKFEKLAGSLKFALVTIVFLSAVVESIINGTFTIGLMVDQAQIWATAVAGIGILDGLAERIGGKKKE